MAKKTAKKKSAQTKEKQPKTTKSSPKQQLPGWFTIQDVEQLKAIANPLRLRILEEFSAEDQTTKQVAKRLGEPPTKLYHHVEALVKHGLLKLQKETPKRGTTEKYYRAVARQFRVDESCLTDSSFADEKSKVILDLLDSIRRQILETTENLDDENTKTITAVAGKVLLEDDQVLKFSESMMAALDQWSNQNKPKKQEKTKTPNTKYNIAILIYPEKETLE